MTMQSPAFFSHRERELPDLSFRERNNMTKRKVKNKKPRSDLPFFMRVKYSGRGIIQLGALLLMALCGYELYIRLDDFRRWTEGIRFLSEARGENFFENMGIILQAESMVELRNILIFLVCCVLFSLFCVIFCNKPKAAYALIPADIGIILLGALLKGVMVFGFGVLAQWLKLIPLLLVLAGCVINLIQGKIAARYRKEHSRPQVSPAPYAPQQTIPAPEKAPDALPVPPSSVRVPSSPYYSERPVQKRERLFK